MFSALAESCPEASAKGPSRKVAAACYSWDLVQGFAACNNGMEAELGGSSDACESMASNEASMATNAEQEDVELSRVLATEV